MPKPIITTLVLIHQDNKLLLGMKKQGFGMGRYNGFGGKVDQGETIEETARRELYEEANIDANDLTKLGIIDFSWKNKAEKLQVHFFKATQYAGQIEESPEMKPEWFDIDNIPYKKMWADDQYWLPLFLENKKFRGHFVFDDKDQVLEHEVKEVDNI